MPPLIATTICVIGILGLFYLDRGGTSRLSQALWIPAVWLFIISSRPISMWLGIRGPTIGGIDATEAYVEGSPVERAVFTILIAAALGVLLTRLPSVAPLLRNNALLLLYLLYCLVSVLWSDFPLVAFKRWTKIIGELAIVLIILTEAHPLVALERLVSRLSFLLFPLSVLFIKYYPHLGRRLTGGWMSEPVGVTTQKNALGLICLMYGVLSLSMFWSAYRRREDGARTRRLWVYGTIVAMVIWLLLQCNSTTSIVGFTLSSAVMWLAMWPSRKPAFVHALVLVELGLCLLTLFYNPGDVVRALGKSSTFSGRTDIWQQVLGMHTNPLIGTGFESFWLGPRLDIMRAGWAIPINEAHNGWLEVYINLGWIGVCFIAALVVTTYTRVMFRFREDPGTATLFLGFILCTLFNAFSENAFRIMTPSWVFFVVVVVAGSQAKLFRHVSVPGAAQRRNIAADKQPTYVTTAAQSFAKSLDVF